MVLPYDPNSEEYINRKAIAREEYMRKREEQYGGLFQKQQYDPVITTPEPYEYVRDPNDTYLDNLEKNYPLLAETYKRHNLKPPPSLPEYEPLNIDTSPTPEQLKRQQDRHQELLDQRQAIEDEKNNRPSPYQSLGNAFTNTGNVVAGTGSVISYIDPYTGSLISGAGAGLSGIGSVINYLTTP